MHAPDLPEAPQVTVGKAVLTQAISPGPLALMRLFLTEARRFPDLIAEVDATARSRVVDIVADALLSGHRDAMSRNQAVPVAEHLLDLTFAPIILAAPTGRDAAMCAYRIASTIEIALDAMDRNDLLQ